MKNSCRITRLTYAITFRVPIIMFLSGQEQEFLPMNAYYLPRPLRIRYSMLITAQGELIFQEEFIIISNWASGCCMKICLMMQKEPRELHQWDTVTGFKPKY